MRARHSAQRPAMGSAAGLTFFRLIAEHGTDVASVHKRDGEFVFVAPTALRLFGWKDVDLLGDSLVSLCHESDQLKLQLALRVEAGSTEKVAYRVRCADGQERWVETVVQSGPSPDLVVCMTRDVTEHKKNANALERGLRTLIHRSPEAMLLVQEGRVKDANTAAIELLGGRSDEGLTGKSLRGLLHPDDATAELEALGAVESTDGGSLPLHDVSFLRSDGQTVPSQAFAVSVAHSGRSAVLVTFHARSKAADALVAERLRAIGVVATRLAADLADPLALLASSIELIAGTDQEPSRSADRNAAVNEARDATARALIALRAMRTFARGEALSPQVAPRNTLPAPGSAGARNSKPPRRRTSMAVPVAPARNTLRVGRRPTVLIVDDDPQLGPSLQRLLRSEYEVTFETSAPAALHRVNSGEAFDAIVCDVLLPGMSGVELHCEIRKRAPELARRVIFMTGALVGVGVSGEPLPAEHLDKPFLPDELRAKLREITARR